MADNKYFKYIKNFLVLRTFTESQNPSKIKLKSLFLPPKRTLDLEYQDGGDELQNLITEITAMRDPGLFISVIGGES